MEANTPLPPVIAPAAPSDENGDETLRYWLALARAPRVGPRTFLALITHFPDLEQLFRADREQLRGCGMAGATIGYLRRPDWRGVERDLAWREEPGNRILTLNHRDYPPRLRAIADAPPVLYLRGNASYLIASQLGIVGSRNPSAGGRAAAGDFARELSAAGLLITSGLALGVDGAAHRGALETGHATVAVTGCGLDTVYPKRHRDLSARIAERGVLVSELAPGTPPRAENFPRRNRIISGLSLGVLVIEAALKSGSLITARLAAEQGREVFAMPGSIHNPLARGCHRLLREGAGLAENGTDVLDGLTLFTPRETDQRRLEARENTSCARSPSDPRQARLLEIMAFDPLPLDSLIQRSGLTADAVSAMLLELELHGFVAAAPGGLYCRAKQRD